MRLMINHQTHFQYSEAACNSIQYIKMMPVSNAHQKVHHWNISVPGDWQQQMDVFHNPWLTAVQRYSYSQMTIMAQGVIELNPATGQGPQCSLNPFIFLQPTAMTQSDAEMRCFAHRYVRENTVDQLKQLAQALLQYMPYKVQATSVCTSAIEAFQRREGVCQDHSHVFIAMCKALGIPARYVSGYLFADNSTHLASHAWAEAYLNDTWYCFDISNQIFSPQVHVYVATGRDYWDVAPIRGVREKGGTETMQSIVQVLTC